jgi:hypothetical protein
VHRLAMTMISHRRPCPRAAKRISTTTSRSRIDGSLSVGSLKLQAALERIACLEAENACLEAENQRLLGQFACWAYNARTRGLGEAFLSRPLQAVYAAGPDEPVKFTVVRLFPWTSL